MEQKKSSEIDISKIEVDKSKNIKVCNSCKSVLPKILDRNICPFCGRIN